MPFSVRLQNQSFPQQQFSHAFISLFIYSCFGWCIYSYLPLGLSSVCSPRREHDWVQPPTWSTLLCRMTHLYRSLLYSLFLCLCILFNLGKGSDNGEWRRCLSSPFWCRRRLKESLSSWSERQFVRSKPVVQRLCVSSKVWKRSEQPEVTSSRHKVGFEAQQMFFFFVFDFTDIPFKTSQLWFLLKKKLWSDKHQVFKLDTWSLLQTGTRKQVHSTLKSFITNDLFLFFVVSFLTQIIGQNTEQI